MDIINFGMWAVFFFLRSCVICYPLHNFQLWLVVRLSVEISDLTIFIKKRLCGCTVSFYVVDSFMNLDRKWMFTNVKIQTEFQSKTQTREWSFRFVDWNWDWRFQLQLSNRDLIYHSVWRQYPSDRCNVYRNLSLI